MRVLWTMVKVVLGLAIAIPVGIIVLATALGLFGAMVGLAFLALRVAVFCLIAWGMFVVARTLLFGKRSPAPRVEPRQLPPVDPYYEAARRELDRELGHTR